MLRTNVYASFSTDCKIPTPVLRSLLIFARIVCVTHNLENVLFGVCLDSYPYLREIGTYK